MNLMIDVIWLHVGVITFDREITIVFHPYTCATCRYTLKVLSDIGDGEKINDQVIVDWVNSTLQKGQKQSTISNFKVRGYIL